MACPAKTGKSFKKTTEKMNTLHKKRASASENGGGT
jgi:hypothetical protein